MKVLDSKAFSWENSMKRIIVVDDSEVNLYLIETIFETNPEVEVKLVAVSSNAMKEIRSFKPHLAVLDLMMPRVSGYDILDEIRKDEAFSRMPVLIISARFDKESIAEAYARGATDYIVKPIKLAEVKDRIEKMLIATEII